jgi:heme oxygenase (biliverdin-IX-beta and delta-forming)
MPEYPARGALSTVRLATRSAHTRLESSLDLGSWDTSRHRWWTARLLGLHEPLEDGLNRWWAEAPLPATGWMPRRRSALLAADLRALGLSDPDVRALPRCVAPAATGLAQVLGQLYVLDGSALGGAVIASQAMAAGVSPQACRSLVLSAQSARCWRQTRALIDALDAEDAASAAASAGELFELLEGWLATDAPVPMPVNG